MKIAYLVKVRPDLEDIVPADVSEYVRIHAGDDGRYSDADLAKLREVDAFVIGMEPVHEQILAAAPNLKIVQRLGVGYETLDLEAIAKRQIPACNIEGVNKEAVAEHTMSLLLALAKKLPQADSYTQAADWASARVLTQQTFELKDKTIGIIGFGNTGSSLAKRAAAFDMQVVYNDAKSQVNKDIAESVGAREVGLDELLANSDVVSISTDLNQSSRNLIDASAIAKMQTHAILLCCARGGIVDEHALADALRSEKIAGAGIDVFEIEPIPTDNPLIGCPNCILTAHVAGVAHETTMRIWQWAHDNVRAVVQRGERARWIPKWRLRLLRVYLRGLCEMSNEEYEVYAIKYGDREGLRGQSMLRGDPHDAPLNMDYFVWLIRNSERSVVVDLGFSKQEGEARGRRSLRSPAEGLALLGVDARDVRDVIITHMHYDHAGNIDEFPSANFHLQDEEMNYATGRAMTHPFIRHSYALDDVLTMVKMVYGDRVVFHCGDETIMPGISVHHVPGHTRGLQCVRVNTQRGPIVLASDTSHYYENIEQEWPFSTLENLYLMLEGFRKVKSLASDMQHIVPGHDPLVLHRYPSASAELEGVVAALHLAPNA